MFAFNCKVLNNILLTDETKINMQKNNGEKVVVIIEKGTAHVLKCTTSSEGVGVYRRV